VHWCGQEAAEGEEQHREKGGATEVHAESPETRAVCHPASGRHIPGERVDEIGGGSTTALSSLDQCNNLCLTLLYFI